MFTFSITPGVGSCLSAGGAPSATGEFGASVPDHLPFWFKPDSILGLSLLTAFISTSPGLTCPGLLAPDRRDAGSRRVGSRVHGRSEDPGYVVPQASDLAVAGDARWGGRPMAEHRVMSEDLLGITHYRSRRCYESQANGQKPTLGGEHRFRDARSAQEDAGAEMTGADSISPRRAMRRSIRRMVQA